MSRPTLADVAQKAGVSVSTASLAFSGAGPIAPATRERVLAAAASLGYSGPDPVARSLRRGSSGIVAVIAGRPLSGSFRDPVSVQTLDGIAAGLEAGDLGMLVIPADGAMAAAPALVQSAAMDAAICKNAPVADDPSLVALRARGVPTVTLDSAPAGSSAVTIADRSGMRDLAIQVRELGHERVAVVALPFTPAARRRDHDPLAPPHASVVFTRNRLAGVIDAGIRPLALLETAGSLVEEGFHAGQELLALPVRPTAVMAQSDLLAAGVLLAAREAGLDVPGDVSVTGFDGVTLPWLAPDVITSVAQQFVRKGTIAAQLAIEAAAGGGPRTVSLDVEPRPGTTLGPAPR